MIAFFCGRIETLLLAYKLSLALALGLGFVLALQVSFPSQVGTFSDLATPALAGLAALSAGLTMRRYEKGLGTRSGKIWLSFTVGILLWFFGETVWLVYTHWLNVEIPYPSAADVFYITGYFPLLTGLVLYVSYFKPAIHPRVISLIVALTLVSASVVVVFLLNPLVTSSTSPLEWFVDLAYPLLDLSMLSVATLGLVIFVKGRLGPSWLFLAVGILLNVFADLLFSYATLTHSYYSGHPVDFLFLWGYGSFTLAFTLHRKEL